MGSLYLIGSRTLIKLKQIFKSVPSRVEEQLGLGGTSAVIHVKLIKARGI